jgi:hypothetical protein
MKTANALGLTVPHPPRNHRCRRPAELARATGAADRRAMAMSRDQRRALLLLAAAPNGATEAEQREMRAGRQPIKVIWPTITDIGRLALAG